MKRHELIRTFKQVPSFLIWLLVLSLLGTVSILLLRLIPEKIALGEEIGNVMTTLCLAYVTGFITSFLWHHIRRTLEHNRLRSLRENVVVLMAACHNELLKAMIEDASAIAPFEPPDYTTFSDTDVDRLAREGWQRQMGSIDQTEAADWINRFRDGAIESFQEQFEDIDPFLSLFHPTFVTGINRIKRELRVRTVVGTNGVPSLEHAIDGPLMQFARIRGHIQWLRDVSRQIEDDSEFDFFGAIPRFTPDQLRARGVPEAMLRTMGV